MIDAQLHAPRPRFRTATRVAIVGAGFSGTMLALNLLEQSHVEVLLIERDRHRMGRVSPIPAPKARTCSTCAPAI